MNATPDVAFNTPAHIWRDYLELTKPRITFFCLLMTLGGAAMAPEKIDFAKMLLTLLGAALSVGSANALNMVWERESDKLMKRTANRPLSAGRMNAKSALIFAIGIGIASVLILGMKVNWTTALLSLFALLSYVLCYTPLKRVTPHALLVGAVPGAIPPLLGWTSITGEITLPGIILFAILLVWQIPHFIAIAVNHADDYRNAGIKTWPGERGLRPATIQALTYSVLLIPISLMLIWAGVASFLYGIVAFALGIWMVVLSRRGLNPEIHNGWAKRLFIASLVYLPALTAALAIDRILIR
ncbi:MAG: heme o synthase [Silvanigrellaceae bacterium]